MLGVQVVVEGARSAPRTSSGSPLASSASRTDFQLWMRRFERPTGGPPRRGGRSGERDRGVAHRPPRAPAARGAGEATALDLYYPRPARLHHTRGRQTCSRRPLFSSRRRSSASRTTRGSSQARARADHGGSGAEDESEGVAHVALAHRTRRGSGTGVGAPSTGEPLVALASYHLVMGDYRAAAREVNDALRRAPSLPGRPRPLRYPISSRSAGRRKGSPSWSALLVGAANVAGPRDRGASWRCWGTNAGRCALPPGD